MRSQKAAPNKYPAKSTCGSCGHFYSIHSIRGCSAQFCSCKLKVKVAEK